jgi:geranylgeranyl reductase family protein
MTDAEGLDVLVVGAGPAGSRAAEAAARAGASVLMVDKRDEVGLPVQCAEFLPRRVAMDLGLPEVSIAQDVEGTLTHIGGEVASTRRNPGCIVRRDVVDRVLASRAVEAGAELWTSTMVTGARVDGEGATVKLSWKGREGGSVVRAGLIVGADGPRSTIGAVVSSLNTSMVVAHQVTVELAEPSSDTEVYLDPAFPGGYGWLFPKGDVANVGVGVDIAMGGSSKEGLDRLLGLLGDRLGKVVGSTGGFVPVGGRLPTVHDRVLLAGDAAGHTHPITGGGIHQAVEAGRLAGEAAAAFVAGDEAAPTRYAEAFEDLFSVTLDRANARRTELLEGWEDARDDHEAFDRLMRRTWIGFPEYYKGGGGD